MQSLYIAGAGPGSGKSAVVLGFMEMLAAAGRKVGFFRPIVRASVEEDDLTNLIRSRYELPVTTEMLYGCTAETALHLVGGGKSEELAKIILSKFKALEEGCDLVVCAGTDFDNVVPSLEFEFNARVANELGCMIVIVVAGAGRSLEETSDAARVAQESLRNRGGDLLAVVINRAPEDQAQRLRELTRDLLPDSGRVYVLPEQLSLGKPTIREIRKALGAECICGEEGGQDQVVSGYRVAAMHIQGFLDHVKDPTRDDGCLIVTPADRADIILASLLADRSTAFPRIAGLLLTGGQRPAENVQRLLDGLERTQVPILGVATDTFTAALHLSGLGATILAGDERKIAAALGVFEANVDLADLRERIDLHRSERRTPLMFEYELLRRAKAQRRHIVLPEGTDERILKAAEILTLRGVAQLTLLGEPDQVQRLSAELGLSLEGIAIVDPKTSPERARYAANYFELREHKGISEQLAYDLMEDVSYFGTAMVHHGDAHGMVSGAAHTTQHTIRPAFEMVKMKPGVVLVSSVFFMCLPDRVLVYGDCAVNPNPTAEQLADIAITSAGTAAAFGIEPRVAMLSYSTGESGKGEDVERVREAAAIARQRRPDLKLEGPIQYDAAVDASVARSKLPGSEVAGQATVFIFPDLNTGNNTYKAVQRSAGALAVGPVLQGLNKPVNDLSRGCLVADIVNTVAITAIQAQDVPS